MKRWRCKGSVMTADREYVAGDVIELGDEHAAQLVGVDKLEADPVSSGGQGGGGEVLEVKSTPVAAPKPEPSKPKK